MNRAIWLSAAFVLMLAGCREPTLLFACPSPSGEVEAVLTGEWQTDRTRPAGAHRVGRLYIRRITSLHALGRPILETVPPVPVRITWLDPQSLRVEYPSTANVVEKPSHHGEATITFAPEFNPEELATPAKASECHSNPPAA